MISPAASDTDEDLATQAGRRGSDAAAAFSELVRRYGVRLLGMLRTCGVPSDQREDVAQEVWLRIWRALPAWRPEHFRGFLFHVARNAAEDNRRKNDRRFARNVPDGEWMESVADSAAAPDREAASRDDVRKLADCLKRLNPEQRALVEGHAGGEGYEEMAARFCVPVGTVRSRLSRAREALRACMGDSAP